ncbi:MAG: hypothetical protein CM15mP49_06590 [Actinomycetota bacterium]|nr:MAG: hypothetical protein CM15mP49_06590 [Actinomycetota bacterium]
MGVPDPEWGEGIVAVIALKSGSEVSTNELLQMCKESELTSIKFQNGWKSGMSFQKCSRKDCENEIRTHFWGEGRKV